jgi:hypothetical protein
MASATIPTPMNTTLALRSRSVRSIAWCASADFFRSETARFIPAPSCLRMRKSVKPAPTSMPPTAIGRTIENHTLKATPLQ